MDKILNKVFICIVFLLLTGCTSIKVKELDPSVKVSHICIKENPKVIVHDFLPIVQKGFTRHGITTEVYKNNILPVVDITQVLLKTFKKKKKGLIISISSQSIFHPPVGSGLYSIVKSVIEQLSKIWNSEYEKYGITSKVVSPSFMRTNLTSDIDERIIEIYYENKSNLDEINFISNDILDIIKNIE